ncbi:MAG: ABC transporter substrate-binding protein [Dehalococcoidia bacterium]
MAGERSWRRGAQQWIGRRRALAIAGAGSAAAFLAACGGDGDDRDEGSAAPAGTAGAASGGTPKKGGELELAVGDPGSQSLDPHITLNAAMFYWGLISNLMAYSDPQKLEPIRPGLVESWEQIAKDTIILHTRPGVTFHGDGKITNGRALTAKDIAYTINRIYGLYDQPRLAQFQRRSDFAGMDKAEAVDERDVRVSFKEPNSSFFNGLADWRNWVVPEELVQKDPNFKDPQDWTSTGPFILDSWDSSTQTGRYVRNPNYWEPDQPHLAGVQQIQFPDAAGSMSAFLSGKLDFRSAFSEEDRNQITKGRPDATIVSWEHSGWEYVRINQARGSFGDVRVRKAIFLALNYPELLDANYGKGYWDFTGPLVSGYPGAWTSAEAGAMPGWNPATKQQDIAEAKKLMEAAGFPNGGIEFSIVPSAGAGSAWNNNGIRTKDQLERVFPAIKVTIKEPADSAGFARSLGTGDYDVTTYGSFPPPSVLLEATLHYRTGAGRNYTKFSDAEVDRLIDAGNQEFDTAARNGIVGELQKRLLETVFAIPLGKRKGVFAHSAKVQGFSDFSGPGTFESYDPFFAAKQIWKS